MTREQAARILDPETATQELFAISEGCEDPDTGAVAAAIARNEACIMGAAALRTVDRIHLAIDANLGRRYDSPALAESLHAMIRELGE